jgi:cytochrome c peroxidase
MAALRHVPTSMADAAANDQINCVLRAVGTFPGTPDSMNDGIAPNGVTVHEVRPDMMTLAQGATGYNPPSLFGMATGAPYFHAGNARSLEEVFSATFTSHHTALSANFLSTGDVPTQVRQIVAFLLSIDESAAAVPVMGSLPYNPDLCPTAFP